MRTQNKNNFFRHKLSHRKISLKISFLKKILVLVSLFVLCVPLIAQRPNILAGLKFAPIQFEPAPIREQTIGRSQAYLLSDTSLPYFQILFLFPGQGLLSEGVDEAGLLGLSLDLWKQGGSKKRSGEEMASLLSELGTRISFSYNEEYVQISLMSLSTNFDASLRLLEEMLLEPRLDPNTLRSLKERSLTAIERRNERPAGIARRKLKEALFPNDRRGYSIQKSDIKKVTKEKIRERIHRILSSKSILALSGDFEKTAYKTRLKDLLARFPSKNQTQETGPLSLAKIPVLPYSRLRRTNLSKHIFLIPKKVPQSVIALGGFLPAHNHPDFFALQLGNYILGGGSFNSRLMKEIRVKRGLAYYAYSYNDFRHTYGRFIASTGVQSQASAQSLRLMLDLIESMKQPVRSSELNLAKTAILNSLIFQFDSPEKQLQNELRFRMHEMPKNYMKLFPEILKQKTAIEIAQAYQTYIHTDQLSIIVVGPASLKKSLSKIRPVILADPEAPLTTLVSKRTNDGGTP